MQEFDKFDFWREFRFQGRRFICYERSEHVLADDSMEVALMTELLHRGADAKQADEMVSFCRLLLDAHNHCKCTNAGLEVTQCLAALLQGS